MYNICRKCGNQNPEKNRFCSRCGEQLSNAVPGTPQPKVANAFASSAATAPQTPVEAQPAVAPVATPAADLPNRDVCPGCKAKNPKNEDLCSRCGMPLNKGISLDDQGDLALLKINMEQLDFENHRILKPVFKGLVRKKIIIDVSDVKWMDSTGIGSLVTMTYQGARTGQSIKIVGMNKTIFNAVKALQVDNVLEVAENANACRVEWGLPPV